MALQAACAGHDGLYARLTPLAHLLREDSAGQPVVIHTGSIYVTKGTDRRSTGTHYTPREQTEQVVKSTLDPLLYAGVSEGIAPSAETLKAPTEVLALKVCDLACGSGAFLVQACRYMAERVVEGWARAEAQFPGAGPLAIPEAVPAGASHSEQLLPADPEERLALARRLVAERCLYGVDLNPMAVEMAKLSLWLVTLHKHRPFTFLDHAIKCGDSLLGLHDPAQLERFHLVPSRVETRLLGYLLDEVHRLMARARNKREELERFTALDVRDAELKSQLHLDAERSLATVRVLADLIVGAALSTAGSSAERSGTLLDQRLEDLLLQAGAALAPQEDERLAADRQDDMALWPLRQSAARLLGAANEGAAHRRPFHWLVEFPEVFTGSGRHGFDALVGNPPFVGGQKITGLFGTDYRDHLVLYLADGRRGSADLCVYFFLRANQLLRPGGTFGLLAVNTIAEGDTRQVGLEAMLHQGIALFAARPNFEWPGAAAVVASAVTGIRGAWGGVRRINDSVVPTISAFLTAEEDWTPKQLQANADQSFQGSIVLGMGFMMSPEAAQDLVAKDVRNAEVLFPYLNGEDLNSHPEHHPSRWVINFWDWPLERSQEVGTWMSAETRQREVWLREGRVPDDYPGRTASDFPELLDVVRRLVKPERDQLSGNATAEGRKRKWWLYGRDAKALYHAIGRGHSFARHPEDWEPEMRTPRQVLACSEVTKFLAFAFVTNNCVISANADVFVTQSMGVFAVLQGSIHEVWARAYSARLETRLKYSPGNAFETFPFPEDLRQLQDVGTAYYRTREECLRARGIGLTRLYNLIHRPDVHEPDVQAMRELICQCDAAVLQAYGWQDLNAEHGFHEVASLPPADRLRFTVSEGTRLEVLRRLSAMNRQRYREEQAAATSLQAAHAELAAPRRRAGRPATKRAVEPSAQTHLFGET